MISVLPAGLRGNERGTKVLEDLMVHHEDKVRAIIEIGGYYMDDFGEPIPYTRGTFIILINERFNFTAFVADRIKRPGLGAKPDNFYYKFQEFISEFMTKINNKGINECGFLAEHLEFDWDTFYENISRDFGYTSENISELRKVFNNESLDAWTINKRMEAYRIFLMNCVFTRLYESVPVPASNYDGGDF